MLEQKSVPPFPRDWGPGSNLNLPMGKPAQKDGKIPSFLSMIRAVMQRRALREKHIDNIQVFQQGVDPLASVTGRGLKKASSFLTFSAPLSGPDVDFPRRYQEYPPVEGFRRLAGEVEIAVRPRGDEESNYGMRSTDPTLKAFSG